MAYKDNKSSKPGNIGTRIAKFFVDLKSELKKVVWPDRKKLTQSTITVVSICLIMTIIIFIIDRMLSGTLGAVGFFPDENSSRRNDLVPTVPAVTAPADPSEETSKEETSKEETSDEEENDETENEEQESEDTQSGE